MSIVLLFVFVSSFCASFFFEIYRCCFISFSFHPAVVGPAAVAHARALLQPS
jgi:hypothetical protein